MERRRSRWISLLCLSALLAACGPTETADDNLDSLDAELTDGNAAAQPGKDPALMAALQSQIMVDPALAQQSNTDALRPAGQPYSSPIPNDQIAAGSPATTGPLMRAPAPAADGKCPQCDAARESVTLGALAARQKGARTASCVSQMRYSANWVNRLPRDLPLYPDARVDEAAGSDAGGCALRAVSFSTTADAQAVLDYYYTKAMGAGYKAEHQADGEDHVLGATRRKDDGALVVFVHPRDGGGVDVDLIVNNGG